MRTSQISRGSEGRTTLIEPPESRETRGESHSIMHGHENEVKARSLNLSILVLHSEKPPIFKGLG